ncbi:MAG: hypothetical protein SFU21_10355 [Flavihumibacter sp.]|nr:hypothetical protein [Flavihumibacter sp.]
MYSYALLETGCYYLIQEKENHPITLIRINLDTDHCMSITRFEDRERMEWKKKNDSIFDILELIDDDKVKNWKQYYYNEDEYKYEEDEGDEE